MASAKYGCGAFFSPFGGSKDEGSLRRFAKGLPGSSLTFAEGSLCGAKKKLPGFR